MEDHIIFSDHTWTEDDYLLGCTKGGDLFVIEMFEVI